MKGKHAKEILAACISVFVLLLYYLVYFLVVVKYLEGLLKLVLAVIPLGSSLFLFWALAARIREIRGGEEDDLSKY